MRFAMAVVGVVVVLGMSACGSCARLRPADKVVYPGEACHVAAGWLSCNEEATCLSDAQRRTLGLELPEKTFEERFDCYGVFNNACAERGVCQTLAKKDAPCLEDAMCWSGTCVIAEGATVGVCVAP